MRFRYGQEVWNLQMENKKKIIIYIFFRIRFFKSFEVVFFFLKKSYYNLKEVNLLEEIYEVN